MQVVRQISLQPTVRGTALVNMPVGPADGAEASAFRERMVNDRLFAIRTVVDNNTEGVQRNWERIMNSDAPNRRQLTDRLTAMEIAGQGQRVAAITNVPWAFGASPEQDEVVEAMHEEARAIAADPQMMAQGTTKWIPFAIAGAAALAQIIGGAQNNQAARDAAAAARAQAAAAAAAAEKQAWYSSQNLKTILIAAGVGIVFIVVLVLVLRKRKAA